MGWTFYSASGQRLSTAATSITNLDIDGATDIGAAIVDADLFIIDDGAGGTNRKTTASRLKTYVAAPSQANQAALEAETNEDTYAPPDLLHFAVSAIKAWGEQSATTGASTTDYNMDDATDNGAGDFTLNWTTDFSSGDYSAVCMTTNQNYCNQEAAAAAAGTFRMVIYNDAGVAEDATTYWVIAAGDQ